jgi:hypothetical protein
MTSNATGCAFSPRDIVAVDACPPLHFGLGSGSGLRPIERLSVQAGDSYCHDLSHRPSRDPKQLENVKAGDMLDVTYYESLLVKVSRPPKKDR